MDSDCTKIFTVCLNNNGWIELELKKYFYTLSLY